MVTHCHLSQPWGHQQALTAPTSPSCHLHQTPLGEEPQLGAGLCPQPSPGFSVPVSSPVPVSCTLSLVNCLPCLGLLMASATGASTARRAEVTWRGVLVVRALPGLVAPSGSFSSSFTEQPCSSWSWTLSINGPRQMYFPNGNHHFLTRYLLLFYFKTFQSDPNSFLRKEHRTRHHQRQTTEAKLIEWTESDHNK